MICKSIFKPTMLRLLVFLCACTNLLGPSSALRPVQEKLNHCLETGCFHKPLQGLQEDYPRLPDTLKPYHYDLKLQPHIYSNNPAEFYAEGTVDIHFECLTETSDIVLTALFMDVNVTSLVLSTNNTGSPSAPPGWNSTLDWDLLSQMMTIHLDGPLSPGVKYVLSMEFESILSPPSQKAWLRGLLWRSHTEDGQKKYYMACHLQPNFVRNIYPCFDEPQLKATVSVVMVRKSHMTGLSSMPIKFQNSLPNNWVEDYFETTPVTAINALTFVIFDFDYIQHTNTDGHLIKVWTPRRVLAESAMYPLEVISKIMTWISSYMDYPIQSIQTKTDVLLLHDMPAGASVNWGMLSFNEDSHWWYPGISRTVDKLHMAEVMAHEITHIYFANLVTPSWWSHMWYIEAAANAINMDAMKAVEPDSYNIERFYWENIHNALLRDGKNTSSQLIVEPSTPYEILFVNWNILVYEKGSRLYEMLKRCLGESTYQAAIQNFVKKYHHDNADTEQLWSEFTQQAAADNITGPDGGPINVNEMMNTWTYQMGYPQISFHRVGTTTHVEQTHFLDTPDQEDNTPSPHDYKWYVPVTYHSLGDLGQNWTTSTRVWLAKDNKTVTDIPSNGDVWVSGNVEAAGYYRAHYDTDLRRNLRISIADTPNIFPSVNRAQFIEDTFVMARGNYFAEVDGMDTIKYMEKESNILVWQAALYHLHYTEQMLLEDPLYQDHYKSYMIRLSSALYSQLGWNPTPGEAPAYSELRHLVLDLNCCLDLADCVQMAKDRFQDFLQDPRDNRLEPDQRLVVLCTAMEDAPENEWQFLYDYFHQTQYVHIQMEIADALACSKNEANLRRYISLVTSNGGSAMGFYSERAVRAMTKHRQGRDVVWDHLISNWTDITLPGGFPMGPQAKHRILQQAADNSASDLDMQKLNQLRSTHPPRVGSPDGAAYSNAEETITKNINWLAANRGPLRQWFEDQDGGEEPISSASYAQIHLARYIIGLIMVQFVLKQLK